MPYVVWENSDDIQVLKEEGAKLSKPDVPIDNDENIIITCKRTRK